MSAFPSLSSLWPGRLQQGFSGRVLRVPRYETLIAEVVGSADRVGRKVCVVPGSTSGFFLRAFVFPSGKWCTSNPNLTAVGHPLPHSGHFNSFWQLQVFYWSC